MKSNLDDNHKTWEAYGCPYPDKEAPFLTELQDSSEAIKYLSLFQNIHYSAGTTVKENWKIISRASFLGDVKLLLGKCYNITYLM